MRLINAGTLLLEEFADEKKVKYAILSHRWEEDEITFEQVKYSDGLQNLQHRKAFTKIQNTCTQALQHGIGYVWVDTCCIDKSSSAELSETINSMFRWYGSAQICYAYLCDVYLDRFQYEFHQSAWFTRGWTLQELLAPSNVCFYDCLWNFLGTKAQLLRPISYITSIDGRALQDPRAIFRFSVAERMKWASRRATTRAEDQAYCLMGLFKINMPMLYGEGEKAFLRLQEEIIKTSYDQTIFAWPQAEDGFAGLLAPSPRYFWQAETYTAVERTQEASGFSMTHRGLSLELDLIPWTLDTYLALLDCKAVSTPFTTHETALMSFQRPGILLRRLTADDQYLRVRVDGHNSLLSHLSNSLIRRAYEVKRRIRVNVSQHNDELDCDIQETTPYRTSYGYQLPKSLSIVNAGLKLWLIRDSTHAIIDKSHNIITLPPARFGLVAVLDISSQVPFMKYLLLAFDFDFHPFLVLIDETFRETRDGKSTQIIHEILNDVWSTSGRASAFCNKLNLRHRVWKDSLYRSLRQHGDIEDVTVHHEVGLRPFRIVKGDRRNGLFAIFNMSENFEADGKQLWIRLIREQDPRIDTPCSIWTLHTGTGKEEKNAFRLLDILTT